MSSSSLAREATEEAQLGANPLAFHTPQPEDIHWVKPLLFASGRMGCELCFGNIYAWAPLYRSELAQHGGFLLSRFVDDHNVAYCYPVGEGKLREALALLRADAHLRGNPLQMRCITAVEVERLEQAMPGFFRFEAIRADADYIYKRSDLAELPGKKYHQKRNHIARFDRERSWEYCALQPADLPECLEMLRGWEALNADRDPVGLEHEFNALHRSFANFELFELKGGLLRSEGQIVAFTLGEAINAQVFCTHFEKAFATMPGAYQLINREFAARALSGYEYVNREEDIGSEGLRRAKLSYYPEILLEKYVAVEIC
ncbi:MAG: phosphatidylglycerol lysyltransferase domain-containing protein [Oscillospiraceae bacterium]|jgi:hypothetical protein|nr:phosphatidylglycerol lysyltransferase domain-containing protein [Oscillospiraceae bacterium]